MASLLGYEQRGHKKGLTIVQVDTIKGAEMLNLGGSEKVLRTAIAHGDKNRPCSRHHLLKVWSETPAAAASSDLNIDLVDFIGSLKKRHTMNTRVRE